MAPTFDGLTGDARPAGVIGCDNRWDDVLPGRVEIDPETGEVGHYEQVLVSPGHDRVWELVFRGTGNGSYNAGYQYAAGYHD